MSQYTRTYLTRPPATLAAPQTTLQAPPKSLIPQVMPLDPQMVPTTMSSSLQWERLAYPTLAPSPALRSIPASSLPDPDLVFDSLLRRDEFKEHPGGISSLFFAFADLVIHSCFNTDTDNWDINKASSYLDLSILYGSSEEEVDSVRRKDGTGRLWEDVFADHRLLLMPAASCALLVLLCRNHNVCLRFSKMFFCTDACV